MSSNLNNHANKDGDFIMETLENAEESPGSTLSSALPHKEVNKGLWKGANIIEEDIKEAKQAVFRDAYKFKV